MTQKSLSQTSGDLIRDYRDPREVQINHFAIRCFRDVADGDYIAARMAVRVRLYPQFLWSALQAIEKYLKCILLLNRVPAKDVGHDIALGLRKVRQETRLGFRTSPQTDEFLAYLNTYGSDRYFQSPYHVMGEATIIDLDRAVWEARRYCSVLDHTLAKCDKRRVSAIDNDLKRVESSDDSHPTKFKASWPGEIERIMADKKHPAREPLLWQNAFFGKRPRKTVKVRLGMYLANSPLSLNPEILDEIKHFVKITVKA